MRNLEYISSSMEYYSPARKGLSLMSLRIWKTPLKIPSVVMTNPSIGMRLLRIGREKDKL